MFENGCYLRRQKRFKCSTTKKDGDLTDKIPSTKSGKRKMAGDGSEPKAKRRNSINTSATDIESSPASELDNSRLMVPIESPKRNIDAFNVKQEVTFTAEIAKLEEDNGPISHPTLQMNQFAGLASYLPTLPITSASDACTIPYPSAIDTYTWNSWNTQLQPNLGIGIYQSHLNPINSYDHTAHQSQISQADQEPIDQKPTLVGTY